MKVSYFETAHYLPPRQLPAEWPVPPEAYDREAGAQSYQGMVERMKFVEELGFDWISVAEHHYSPQRLTPNPVVSAAHLAAYATKIKIAVLGPIVSQSNPVKVAEELAMLDNLTRGRLVVGLCAVLPASILPTASTRRKRGSAPPRRWSWCSKPGPNRSLSAGRAGISSFAQSRFGPARCKGRTRRPTPSGEVESPAS